MATLCKRKTVPHRSATKTKSPSLPLRRPRPFFFRPALVLSTPVDQDFASTSGFLTSGFLTSGFLSVGLELQATFCARAAVSSSSSARLPACFNSLVSPSLLCVMAGWGTRAEWKSLWLSLQFQLSAIRLRLLLLLLLQFQLSTSRTTTTVTRAITTGTVAGNI